MQHIYKRVHPCRSRKAAGTTDTAWAAEGWMTGSMDMAMQWAFFVSGALAGVTGTRMYARLSRCACWEVRSKSRNGTLLVVPVLLTCEPENFETRLMTEVGKCVVYKYITGFASIENKIHIIKNAFGVQTSILPKQASILYTFSQTLPAEAKGNLGSSSERSALIRLLSEGRQCDLPERLSTLPPLERGRPGLNGSWNKHKQGFTPHFGLDLLIVWGSTNCCCATFGLYGNLMVSLLPGELVCSMFISFLLLVHV